MRITKLSTLIALIFLSINLNAAELVSLIEGRNISRNAVEVSDEDTGVITLEFDLIQNLSEEKLHAFVSQEIDGFKCAIHSVEIVSDEVLSAYQVKRIYQIEVLWSPGQDWSSCSIEVSAEDLKRTGVVLYIQGPSPSPFYDHYRP